MNTIGFLISEKENEKRRPLVYNDIEKISKKNRKNLFFQEGYGKVLGFSDKELLDLGCNVVKKEDIFNCDIICDPKIGDSKDLSKIKEKTIFGWVHATQNYDITQTCIDNKLTVYAWEKMYEDDRHVFYKNNQIAGQASVLHAMFYYGKQFNGLNVAVLGRGNTAIGAIEVLNKLGANIEVYNRKMEKAFIREMSNFDVIVNCVLWDVTRKDHIINKKDLKKLKKGALIIDVSCDKAGAIESSRPTTIENPVYIEENVMHYVADHTPSLLFSEASNSISREVVKYIDELINGSQNKVLENSKIIENGKIKDDEINKFQKRN